MAVKSTIVNTSADGIKPITTPITQLDVSYNKTSWVNGGGNAINQDNLNKIELGIATLYSYLYGSNPSLYDDLEGLLEKLNEVIEGLNAECASRATQYGSLNTAIVGEINRSTEKEQELNDTKADKTTVETLENNYKSADAEIRGNINTVRNTVSSNKSIFERYVSDNDSRVSDIESRLNGMSTSIGNNTFNISKVNSDVTNIEKDYLKASDKVDLTTKINTEESARKSADSFLSDRITELNTKVSRLDIGAINASLEAVNSAVESINSLVGTDGVLGLNDLSENGEEVILDGGTPPRN
jgi:chromosome segregation ATPase